ncbi:hypothetical protein EVG20_g5319, partial [Dentipellis fragilis]
MKNPSDRNIPVHFAGNLVDGRISLLPPSMHTHPLHAVIKSPRLQTSASVLRPRAIFDTLHEPTHPPPLGTEHQEADELPSYRPRYLSPRSPHWHWQADGSLHASRGEVLTSTAGIRCKLNKNKNPGTLHSSSRRRGLPSNSSTPRAPQGVDTGVDAAARLPKHAPQPQPHRRRRLGRTSPRGIDAEHPPLALSLSPPASGPPTRGLYSDQFNIR